MTFDGYTFDLWALTDHPIGDWKSYYGLYSGFPRTRDIVLIIYDRANVWGFECSTKKYLVEAHLEMHKNLQAELRKKNTAANQRQANCVFALVGLQKYENDEPTPEECDYWKNSKYVSTEDGEALAKTIPNCRYFEVVLSTGAGVDDVFNYVLKNAIKTVRRAEGMQDSFLSKIKRLFRRSTINNNNSNSSSNSVNNNNAPTNATNSTTRVTKISEPRQEQSNDNACSSTDSGSGSISSTTETSDIV